MNVTKEALEIIPASINQKFDKPIPEHRWQRFSIRFKLLLYSLTEEEKAEFFKWVIKTFYLDELSALIADLASRGCLHACRQIMDQFRFLKHKFMPACCHETTPNEVAADPKDTAQLEEHRKLRILSQSKLS